MKPLIILTGPTAVGKTALSVRLAKAIGGEIISADSMQVYRHMDIGSAKVTRDEMEGIPHYLIDILEPTGEFNVAVFKKMAKSHIQIIDLLTIHLFHFYHNDNICGLSPTSSFSSFLA